jgi:hypothetical protein
MYDSEQITAPHSKTRKAAWERFEASVLSTLLSAAPRASSHLKKWNKVYRNKHLKFFLFAHAERPNRGEILIYPINATEGEWVNIMRPHLITRDRWMRWSINSERFPDVAKRQRALLTREVETTQAWMYLLGASIETIQALEATRHPKRNTKAEYLAHQRAQYGRSQWIEWDDHPVYPLLIPAHWDDATKERVKHRSITWMRYRKEKVLDHLHTEDWATLRDLFDMDIDQILL